MQVSFWAVPASMRVVSRTLLLLLGACARNQIIRTFNQRIASSLARFSICRRLSEGSGFDRLFKQLAPWLNVTAKPSSPNSVSSPGAGWVLCRKKSDKATLSVVISTFQAVRNVAKIWYKSHRLLILPVDATDRIDRHRQPCAPDRPPLGDPARPGHQRRRGGLSCRCRLEFARQSRAHRSALGRRVAPAVRPEMRGGRSDLGRPAGRRRSVLSHCLMCRCAEAVSGILGDLQGDGRPFGHGVLAKGSDLGGGTI